MQDFDKARHERIGRDRSFKIGGQTMTFRASMQADALAEYHDAFVREDGKPLREKELLQVFDRAMESFLEPASVEVWQQVRARDAQDPISGREIVEVIDWGISVATGNPTAEPSGSSTGSETAGTSSTDTSPSTEAP